MQGSSKHDKETLHQCPVCVCCFTTYRLGMDASCGSEAKPTFAGLAWHLDRGFSSCSCATSNTHHGAFSWTIDSDGVGQLKGTST
ncbi:hypothetical protein AOLI_G00205490 [Acnodon oligacanthus]